MEEAAFTKHLAGIYQHGCLMLAFGIGHDLGLFKAICEAKKHFSLQEIADSLNLKERYTMEWLSTMVAAGVILQDRSTALYSVPEGHKHALKMHSAFAAVLFTLGKRSDSLKECFKKDGPYGISYQDSPGWFDWFNGYRTATCENTIDEEIIPLLAKHGVIHRLESGIKVLDVGCGTGNYTNVLAQRFPNSTFIGLDYAECAIERANQTKEKNKQTNLTFTKGDAHYLSDEWTKTFDMVFVYDVLHDLPNPFKALEQIYKVLKDDGCFSLVEMGFHSNPVDNASDGSAAMYYVLSSFICLPSSMTEAPHVGYGACWGVEEVYKALEEANFKIEGKMSLVVLGTKQFFFCTK